MQKLVNVAQLAAALWQIKQNRKQAEVRVMREDGAAQTIGDETPQEIEAKLKQLLKD